MAARGRPGRPGTGRLAPRRRSSDELRRWFGHDPARWAEFRRRYVAELDASPETWAPLRAAAAECDVVLLYAARDREHNNAIVLRDHLEQATGSPEG